MKQQCIDRNSCIGRARKMELLEMVGGVLLWPEFVSQLMATVPHKATGRPQSGLMAVLRLYLIQQVFSLLGFAIEETPFDMPLHRTFPGMANYDRLPNQGRIPRFSPSAGETRSGQAVFSDSQRPAQSQRLDAAKLQSCKAARWMSKQFVQVSTATVRPQIVEIEGERGQIWKQ